ncbi:MAG: plasmid pRiA4b ORF-3 family protein, partial [Bacteroidales bacterium]|nr:plasmid pRiA4b ORF-3 family protein [Bacteroidales bacterium]
IRDRVFALPHPEDALDDRRIEDERKALLHRLVAAGDSFLYRYDLGDNWQHLVIVETVQENLDHAIAKAHGLTKEGDCTAI